MPNNRGTDSDVTVIEEMEGWMNVAEQQERGV